MSSRPRFIRSDLRRALFIALAIVAALYALVLLAWVGVGTTADPRTPGLLRYRHAAQIWGLLAGAALAFGAIIGFFWLLGRLGRGAATAAWVGVIVAVGLALNLGPRLVGAPLLTAAGWLTVPLLAPGYRVHLPLLNLWLGGALALVVARHVWGKRSRLGEWGGVGLGLAGSTILARIAATGRFSQVDGLVKPALWIAAALALTLSIRRAVSLSRSAEPGSGTGTRGPM